MTSAATAPPLADRLDPLRSCPDGRYSDELVVVSRGEAIGIRAWRRPDGRIEVRHRIPPAELDDELAAVLAGALAPHTDDHAVFAHAFTGLVLTCHPVADRAWLVFYRNTLARLRHPHGPGYAGIYRHALALLPRTSVLDLGCSLGFLTLHLAARGVRVTACDLEPGTTVLLRHMATLLRVRPVPDVVLGRPGLITAASSSVDAVAALHVLEHVDEDDARRLLAEAMRVARHRVVVAVPYETEPTALYGHLRALGPADLARWAGEAAPGWTASVHEHLGGWLVLDRVAPSGAAATP